MKQEEYMQPIEPDLPTAVATLQVDCDASCMETLVCHVVEFRYICPFQVIYDHTWGHWIFSVTCCPNFSRCIKGWTKTKSSPPKRKALYVQRGAGIILVPDQSRHLNNRRWNLQDRWNFQCCFGSFSFQVMSSKSQVFQGTFEASAVLKCEQTTHLKRFQDQRSRNLKENHASLSPFFSDKNASGNLLVRVVLSFMENIRTLVCSPTSNSGRYSWIEIPYLRNYW